MIKRNHSGLSRVEQAGMSIVELMIAMVLGLLIVAAVMNMYTGATRSSAYIEGLQTMQDNGRYGIKVLQDGLRHAGYSTTVEIPTIDMARSSLDSIVVMTEKATDCNGASTVPTRGIAVNKYRYIAAEGRIICRGNQAGATNMPLVEGVDGFRLLYGIDDNDSDGSSAPTRFVPYSPSLDVSRVTALRFALLVNSGEAIKSNTRKETYVVLDQEIEMEDQLAREVFSSTIKLRNR